MVTVSRKKKWLRRVGQVSLGAGEAFLTGGMSLLYALHKKNQQRDDTLEEVHEAETPGETEIGEDEPAPGNVTFYRNVTKKVPISKKEEVFIGLLSELSGVKIHPRQRKVTRKEATLQVKISPTGEKGVDKWSIPIGPAGDPEIKKIVELFKEHRAKAAEGITYSAPTFSGLSQGVRFKLAQAFLAENIVPGFTPLFDKDGKPIKEDIPEGLRAQAGGLSSLQDYIDRRAAEIGKSAIAKPGGVPRPEDSETAYTAREKKSGKSESSEQRKRNGAALTMKR